jgi:feruloyl esterase
MTTKTAHVSAAAVLLCASAALHAAPCESLHDLALPHTDVTVAEVIGAGRFSVPGNEQANAVFVTLPEFCRVLAVARPSADSAINIEVWLPLAGWNGKLQSVGNGAWAGNVSYPALATAVADRYAAASTDTGHTERDGSFALGHPERLVDFAHRAVHEMTVVAKALIGAFYERSPQAAYFNGCSTGGRQALAAAQRYPEDYDGIVAGAPANHITHLQGTQLWTALVGARSGGALDGPALRLVNHATLAACDTLDGVADGVLEDPRRCTFDPAALVCGSGSGQQCLSAEQIRTVQMIHAGPRGAATGAALFHGYARGSELGWASRIGPAPPSLAVETFRYLVFADPAWDYRSFDFERDVQEAVEAVGGVMNAVAANLSPFFARGGKLLLYHGWNDPGIPPGSSIAYYERVLAASGREARDSARLFMVPGMNHCRGGVGTDEFDAVSAVDRWVTTNRAPGRLSAARRERGQVVRTRPLCPFPEIAVYDGRGSVDRADSFRCAVVP